MFGKSVSEACGLCRLIIHSFLHQLRHLLGKHSSCGARAQLLQGLWDPSSLTWYQTHIPCIARWILNPWATRGVPPSFIIMKIKEDTLLKRTAQSGANSRNSINVWFSSFAVILVFFTKFTFDLFFKNHPSCPMGTIYEWNEWKLLRKLTVH